MLKICFLVVISPLVTLTYSIDKMGDGKAQAFNTWLKELIFGVLIQPFHCAIYMAFVSMALSAVSDQILDDNNFTEGLASCIIAILAIQFIKPAEQIVRKIFAFKDDSSMTNLAAGATMAAFAFQSSGKIAKGAVKVGKGVKNLPQNIRDARKAFAVEGGAFKAAVLGMGATSGTGGTTEGSEETTPDLDSGKSHSEMSEADKQEPKELPKTFSERFAAEKKRLGTEYDKKIADKLMNKKALSSGNDKHNDADERYKAEIEKETEDMIKASGGTMDKEEAHQAARRKVFKQKIRENGKVMGKVGKSKVLREFRKTAEGIAGLETFKLGKELAKGKIANGIGIFGAAGAMAGGQNIVTAGLTGLAASEATSSFMKEMSKGSISESSQEKALIDAFTKIGKLEDVSEDKYDATSDKAKEELDKLANELEELLKKPGVVEDPKSIQKIRNIVTSEDFRNNPMSGFKKVPADLRQIVKSANKGKALEGDANVQFERIMDKMSVQYAGMALHSMTTGEGARSIQEIEYHSQNSDRSLSKTLDKIYKDSQRDESLVESIQYIDAPNKKEELIGIIGEPPKEEKEDKEKTEEELLDEKVNVSTVDEIDHQGEVFATDLKGRGNKETVYKSMIQSTDMLDLEIQALEDAQPRAGIDNSKTIEELKEKKREIEAKNAEILAAYFRQKQNEIVDNDKKLYNYAQSIVDATIERLNTLIEQKKQEMKTLDESSEDYKVADRTIHHLESRRNLVQEFKDTKK